MAPKQQAMGTGAVRGYGEAASLVKTALDGLPEDQVFTITLNGRETKARAGETIMEVCHREDVYVPHYCWHPALSIAGNCRLCLVEVEKVPKPLIACQTHVAPGMAVSTASAMAKSAQEWMMEFLLVNHPLDCPICDRGGECQLQRYSVEYGQPHSRMADKKRKFIKPSADPLIDIERNRCIMCTRCVRFCDEVGGEHVMGVFARGSDNYIGTFGQGPVSNIFSGNIIDLCPVGCLTSKPYRFKARPWELTQTQTTCDGCSAGCKVTAWTRNGKLYRVTPPSRKRHDAFTINEDTEEFICNQGRFGSDHSFHRTRRDESMVRRAGALVAAPFAKAVEQAAAELTAVIEKHGPESVAVMVGSRATIEEGRLAASLAKDVIGTPSIDWRTGFAGRGAADAVSLALDCADGSLEQWPDVIVVVNGSLSVQSPTLAMRLQELARRFGKTLVMLGHQHDDYLSPHARHAFHTQPGRTADALQALSAAFGGGSASNLASALGTEAANAEALVEALKGAGRGLIVQGLEDLAGLYAPAEVPAAVGLRRALGDGWGYLPVVSDRNAVGLHAVGAEPGTNGVAAADLCAAIHDGRIKGLLVLGAEALGALRSAATLPAALGKLEALVVCDPFENEYTANAGAFLALASNLERDGVYADIEGNLALLKASFGPVGGAEPAWKVLSHLGRVLGSKDFGADSAEDAWTQARAFLAPESLATHADLELEGGTNPAHFVQRQAQGGARHRGPEYNPGNCRQDGLLLRSSGPATIPSATAAPAPGSADTKEGELHLVWGSHVSGRSYVSDRAIIADILRPRPFIELNAADAAKLGVKTNQFVVLHVRGERAKAAVKVTSGPAEGCAYLPAGASGPFDAASYDAPVPVRIEPLNESVPDQGDALMTSEKSV